MTSCWGRTRGCEGSAGAGPGRVPGGYGRTPPTRGRIVEQFRCRLWDETCASTTVSLAATSTGSTKIRAMTDPAHPTTVHALAPPRKPLTPPVTRRRRASQRPQASGDNQQSPGRGPP